jgi:hypothetical protein
MDGAFGVWRLAFGVWRLAFGVWRLAFGVWRLAFGVWRLAFGVWLILDDRNRGNCKHAQRQFAVLLEVWDLVDLWPAAEWHGAPNFLGA